MELRKYNKEDAKEILNWINNEKEFRLWSADRYQSYPITPDDINNNYEKSRELSNFYPLTLVDDNKIIGHLILRNPDNNEDVIRMGFIIVDHSIQGKGYGKALINLAIKYAKETLHAKEINLGVFTCNDGALHCYQSVGFEIVGLEKNAYKFYDEEWDCAEMILK